MWMPCQSFGERASVRDKERLDAPICWQFGLRVSFFNKHKGEDDIWTLLLFSGSARLRVLWSLKLEVSVYPILCLTPCDVTVRSCRWFEEKQLPVDAGVGESETDPDALIAHGSAGQLPDEEEDEAEAENRRCASSGFWMTLTFEPWKIQRGNK